MENIASLAIAVKTGDILKAQRELKKLEYQGKKTETATGKLTKSFKGLATSTKLATAQLFSMKTAMVGIAVVMAGQKLVKYADEMTMLSSKLKLVTDNSQELTKVQEELFKISQEARTGFSDTADLYARMARSTKDTTTTQKELLDVTETISKSLIISGASAESANAALVQLGQGFAADALRGQELNSVLEQTPRLAQAIAEGMGIGLGELRAIAAEGKLTTKVTMDAIRSQGEAINEEFIQMTMTVGQSMVQVDNSFLLMIGNLNEATGLTRDLAGTFSGFSSTLDSSQSDIVAWGRYIYAVIDRTIDIFNLLWEVVENGAQTLVYSLNVVVYGFAAGVSEMAADLTESLNSVNLASDKQVTANRKIADSMKNEYRKAQQGIIDGGKEILEAMYKVNITAEERYAIMVKEEAQSRAVKKAVKDANDESERKIKLTKEQEAALKKQIKAQERQAELNLTLRDTYFSIVGSEYDVWLMNVSNQMMEMAKSTAMSTEEWQKYYDTLMKGAPEEKRDTKALEEKRKQQELDYEFQTAQAELLRDSDDRAIAMANINLQKIKDEYALRVEMETLSVENATKLVGLAEEQTKRLVDGYSEFGRTMESVGQSMESSFMQFADATSEKFGDLKALGLDMAQSIYQALLKNYVIGQAASSTNTMGSGIMGAMTSWAFNAKGGMYDSPSLSAYSNTVVDKPTPFMFASGGVPNMGVMGEKNGGSPEAIMPLTRTSDGDLGVKVLGDDKGSAPKNVTVSIVNESGEQLEVSNSTAEFDMEQMVIGIVLNSVQTNKAGMRTAIGNG